ncbi:MAG: protein kinase, partial [Myxococcota bacterium]
METLARGAALDAGDVRATGAAPGSPIVIERGLGECPHGFWYEARQDEVALLLTVLDPILVAQGDMRARLQRDLQRGAAVAHRNLLRCFGMAASGSRVFVAEAWPAGGTIREFARQRAKHEQPIDGPTAYTVIAHVCNAAAALHERRMMHGYITADTVHVSKEGRVMVAGRGIGATLPHARGFARFRAGGLLPGIAPEQVDATGQLGPATDVFAIAVLFIELLTGKGLPEAGASMSEVALNEPAALVELLHQATAREPATRPA